MAMRPPKPASPAAAARRRRALHGIRESLANGSLDDAASGLSALSTRMREDPEVHFLRGVLAELRHRPAEAIKHARTSLALYEHPEAVALLARACRRAGRTQEALEACDRLDALRHHAAPVLRAGTLEEAGRFDEASAVLAPIVEQHEASGEPLPTAVRVEWSKLLVQTKAYDRAIELIDGTLDSLPDSAADLRRAQLHLKAKAADRAKRYDLAFEAATRANDIGRLEFDPELYTQQVSVLIENWSAGAMRDFPLSTCESEVPVFIAGMPRSGTSLIDQIIDAHPLAAGVGELSSIEHFAYELSRAWNPTREPGKRFGKYDAWHWTRQARIYEREVEKLAAPGVQRIVNKALGNNKLVGLLARLFPNTRIIHAIRDPRDVAISCYMGGFNNRLHPWTTRLDWAAHAWEQSRRMMDHWKATLHVPILDVHYERLVAQPHLEMPRIIDFLGLPWDDRCERFYESKRTVRTLSYDQVNRPLYSSSSGRHANYARWLAGVSFPDYDPWSEAI